jgi:hypothetical protein
MFRMPTAAGIERSQARHGDAAVQGREVTHSGAATAGDARFTSGVVSLGATGCEMAYRPPGLFCMRRARRCDLGVAGLAAPLLSAGGCPSPSLGQDCQSLQRGGRRLPGGLLQLVKQQEGDGVQACEEIGESRRVVRDQGLDGPLL